MDAENILNAHIEYIRSCLILDTDKSKSNPRAICRFHWEFELRDSTVVFIYAKLLDCLQSVSLSFFYRNNILLDMKLGRERREGLII